MKLSLCAGVILLTNAAAVAQATNAFHVYTNRTSFTSRAFLGTAAGETLQGYPAAQYRGIGDAGARPKDCRVYGFGMITQDQDRTTSEKFRVIFRRAALDDSPDGSAAGVIAQTDELTLPTANGTGPIAWNITVNLGTEGVAVPCKATFYAGLSLAANAKWTSDGQSTHASAYTDPSSATGDPVRANAPNHAYQVDANGAVRATNPRSWNYTLRTQRGAFQIGCLQTATGDGLYGNCGNYPDAATHGLAFRLRDGDMADDLAAVFVSSSLIGGMPIPFDGTLWVNPGTFVMVGSGKLDTAGELELKLAPFAPGKLAGFKGTTIPFQAVVLEIGNGRLNIRTMNAQATSL